MQQIRCDKNRAHRMVYQEFAGDVVKNGYYCTKCDYVELDVNLNEDMLKYQMERKC